MLQVVHKQSGFTLTEITIAMAISASLAVVAFTGQGELRRRAQFTAAMDQTKNELQQVKNQANGTEEETGAGNGGATNDQGFFGKRVRFTSGSSTLIVDTLVCTNPSGALACDGSNDTLTSKDSYNVQVPWGVNYTGDNGSPSTNNEIVFVRSQLDGRLQAYVPPSSWSITPGKDLKFSSYQGLTPGTGGFKFTDGSHNGELDIDGLSGTVNRKFL